MDNKINIRALAVQILLDIEQGQSLNTALAKRTPTEFTDKPLLQAMIYGVLRFHEQLMFFSHQLLDKPFKDKDADVKWLILLGLYQLWKMRIKPHAVVNETVHAITKNPFRKSWAKGLINAILRRFMREQNTLIEALNTQAPHFAQAGLPKWLFQALTDAYDAPTATNIGLAGLEHPPLTLRVHKRKTSPETWLKQSQIVGKKTSLSDCGVILEQACDVKELSGFEAGIVSVQDEAAQLAAQLLPLKPGMRILDACAAPGGKTLAMLERVENLEVIALDIDETRLEQTHENLIRGNVEATLITADSREEEWFDGAAFDAILLDAPCSATGVIRRHPDIKLHRTRSDIDVLIETQAEMLDKLWTKLKPHGHLLYATCSVLPQENMVQVKAFLSRTPSASLAPLHIQCGHDTDYGQQILTGEQQMDGFFYALFYKNPVNP